MNCIIDYAFFLVTNIALFFTDDAVLFTDLCVLMTQVNYVGDILYVYSLSYNNLIKILSSTLNSKKMFTNIISLLRYCS